MACGWFFAKIAEPATKTPITRVSATIFVMSPPRRELPESRGPTSMLLTAEVEISPAAMRHDLAASLTAGCRGAVCE